MTIKELIENKPSLNYQQICTTLIQIFRVDEKVNWESVLPAQQQQEYFGGETLRLIAGHPILSKQKDIRPIALKKGSISQMLFFYVCLNDSTLPKKQIQDVTKKFISGGDANRYIIWFFGNKEFTNLKIVLSAKEGKKVVLKTLPFGTGQPYYKTYTFILEKIHEEVNQLFVEPIDLWKALWKAFDISVINNKFYNEIKEAFNDLLKQLNKKGTPFTSEEDKASFAIRLIGRIIFCWFLKRKDVLQDVAISSEAVNSHSHKNYYHDILEPLFFDVLNTPEKERRAGLPKIIAHYPFLNGGLFESQETDYKNHLNLNIDNDWFFNLFSKTLERYNFTVDENSSSNAEIAIDPEMLGRIFENLLAEQDPDTGESARKATGSFYTPRAIVDYMVEQSLCEYLKTYLENCTEQIIEIEKNLFGVIPNQQLSLPKPKKLILYKNWERDIEDFVHTQMLANDLANYEEKLTEALDKIKVLDPACGSGAFPIGILQKVVSLKQQLHPKTKNYKLKLDTIQNSIYGVDIQPMAVELSRLRCWLSLVVDEDPKDIKALPNLDFKFVCADSLTPLPKLKQLNLGTIAETIEEMKTLRTDFFIANGKQKEKLEKDFLKLQSSLFKNATEWAGKNETITLLAGWKPFGNQKTDWFDAFWMFGIKDGFNVVIGNPPYFNIQKLGAKSEYVNSIKKHHSEIWMDKSDILFYFIKTGIEVTNTYGNICFIISNAFLFSDKAQRLRNYILNNAPISSIVNFEKYLVFENAMITTAIVHFKKNKKDNIAKAINIKDEQKIDFESLIRNEKLYFKVALNFDRVFALVNSLIDSLNKKIDESKVPLGDLVLVGKGMETAANEIFSNEGINENIFPKEYIKKRLSGKAIRKFNIDTKKAENILYYEEVNDFNDLPNIIKEYLFLNKSDLEKRATVKNEGRPWWKFSRPMHKDYYHLEKIWTSYRGSNNCFAYDDEGEYIGLTNTTVIFDTNPKVVSLKYILSLLNSKVLNFRYKSIGKQTGNGIFEFFENGISKLPIPVISMNSQIKFITLIDFILLAKKDLYPINPYVSNSLISTQIEEILDAMVLELYFEEELSTKKVNIIELVEKELEKAKSKETAESIYNFYKSVSHPDSEIRNRILSFAIVSPDILKPILQG